MIPKVSKKALKWAITNTPSEWKGKPLAEIAKGSHRWQVGYNNDGNGNVTELWVVYDATQDNLREVAVYNSYIQ